MTTTRRHFLQASAAAIAAGTSTLVPRTSSSIVQAAAPPLADPNAGKTPLRLGLILGVDRDPDAALTRVHELGIPTCQVSVDEFDGAGAARLRASLDKFGLEATSLVVGGPGKEVWDFNHGPETIGLVPRSTRAARVAQIKKASDFAKQAGIPAVQTHCGFIPENPNDPLYKEAIDTMREVASYCRANGQYFRYETGQETPITLIRAIRDVGTDNQGVNFDVANLILYGKANPVDAIELLGPHIQGMHAKDGLWPTNPDDLGEEVAIGKGKVDFPKIIERLKALGYRGAITIERETSGPQQMEDVRASKVYLAQLIG